MNGRSTEKKAAGTFTKPSGLRPPLKAPGKPPLNYLNHSNTKTADGDKKGKPSSSRLANASQNVNQAKTPVRSKAAVKSKPKIAPSVSAKVQEDAEHSIRQKRILEWRERFKQMRFYFDGIDPALALKFRTQIKSLDGVWFLLNLDC